MKRIIFALLLLTPALVATAADVEAPSVAAIERQLVELTEELRKTRGRVDELLERVDTIEQRLGRTHYLPTPFNTVERRIEDLERDVNRLKR